ncbi:ATP-binding protein [Streptomyces sp. NPDC003077]|uniref:ATP-binding protein n=1 Tax=Streptomyces sp. NPDC003077 TaxID=3154443 RepID=UPI0033A5CCF5
MDPNNMESEEYGEQGHPAASPAPAPGGSSGGPVRTVQLVSGPYLVTVNPVDGSEIEPCPPGFTPAHATGADGPRKRGAVDRAEHERAAAPPAAPAGSGYTGHDLPLLDRTEVNERLVRLLSRGRSVRLTGPGGSGRTRLLDAVATACAGLAPDGVVRLSGYHRTATDLMYDLFATVYDAPLQRPDRAELLRALAGIGAVVVVDDLEFGGAALDELLDATPECAFLLAATPDIPAPSPDSHLEEVFLAGLDREACLELLEGAAGRPLTEEEKDWAADLWFESEGLPLRFVQAGALLRQRDRRRVDPDAVEEHGVFAEQPYDAPETDGQTDGRSGSRTDKSDQGGEGGDAPEIPLPAIAEAASPAALLASRLSESARETLRFAVALGGEVPHQAHLPALVQDTHADAALGDLLGCGLISPAGCHYRLATTVREQLETAGYGEGAADRAHSAAQHYAWWAGHPSVTPERAATEADAILAATAVLTGSRENGHASAAVLLVRTAAPAFAAALHWSAWERVLRHGQEAARLAGEVAEEAYFHHELGVLALCSGNLDRARAELEASIGLRGVLSDRRGAVAGRRALALVADRSGTLPPPIPVAGEEVPDARTEESASPPGGVTGGLASAAPTASAASPTMRAVDDSAATVVTPKVVVPAAGAAAKAGAGGTGSAGGKRLLLGGARRNLVAAGAGALLVAVLGTVVTLGLTSGSDKDDGGNRVKTEHSAEKDKDGDGLNADQPGTGGGSQQPGAGPGVSQGRPGGAGAASSSPGATGSARPGSPGSSGSPSPGGTTGTGEEPTNEPTGPESPTGRPTGNPTHPNPPTGRPTEPTEDPTTPTNPPTTEEPTTPPTQPTQRPTTEGPSQTASGSVPSSPVGSASGTASASMSTTPGSASASASMSRGPSATYA